MKEEIVGYVFLCSDATLDECIERSLFGGGDPYLRRVRDLKVGDSVFLYNYSSKKMYGTFVALSTVQQNIVPNAWGGVYPQQVKVRRVLLEDPLSREDMGTLIKYDRTGKPSTKLTTATVHALTQLFVAPQRTKTYRDDIQHWCVDGHMVRSQAEMQIDNWLFENRIMHAYETPVGTDRCDFMVPMHPGNVYIEYWGLKTPEYLANKDRKTQEYHSLGLTLISLYQEDLKDLNKKLGVLKNRSV